MEIAVAADIGRANVGQIAALGVYWPEIARTHVLEPVELEERVVAVNVGDVPVEMEARVEVVRSLAVGGKGVAGGVHDVETAEAGFAEIPGEGGVGHDGETAGVLVDRTARSEGGRVGSEWREGGV